jgi:hypothetical protein
MKALKRTMAGEYSRELGVKVLAGLKRLAALGVKQGGSAGYGLQRMLLSSDGRPKQLLSLGERKSIATERVTLVPGPINEVETVREIYRMFVHEKHTVHTMRSLPILIAVLIGFALGSLWHPTIGKASGGVYVKRANMGERRSDWDLTSSNSLVRDQARRRDATLQRSRDNSPAIHRNSAVA